MGVTILDVVTQPADNCGHLMHGGQQSDIRMARARGDTAPNNGFTRRRFAARPSRMTALITEQKKVALGTCSAHPGWVSSARREA
jgi:hypothetical protein